MFRNIICLAIIFMFCSLVNGQSIEYHGLCVGINDYPGSGSDLNWCIADAQGIKQSLSADEGWLDENITLLTDAAAYRSNILNKISAMPRTTGYTDLFHYSGHGSTSGLWTVDELDLSPSQLQSAFGSFNQYTAFLDACQTGVFTSYMTTGVILAACRSDEYASEDGTLQHGTFSYYLLQGLTNNTAAGSDGLTSAEELYSYASPLTTNYDPYMHPQLKDNYSGGLVLNYNIYVPQQYSSISSALSASHSGQTVVLSSGNQSVTSNLTVPSGVTLQIKHAVTIFFDSGISLIANGTLNAQGTSSNLITFIRSGSSGAWGGIQLNSGSSGSTISYCIIRYADKGIYENGVSVNVSYSAISNCTNGIYLYSSNPTIQRCTIHNNTSYGINMLYSSNTTVLRENYIHNNDCGVFCANNSTPVIGIGSNGNGNYISNNNNGIICFNNANPNIGKTSPLNGGYNNLVNNIGYNVLNTTGNTIYAYNNWWGTTDPTYFKANGLSTPYLTSPAAFYMPPLSKTSGNLVASEVEEIPMLSELDKAYQLVESKNLAEARKVCLNLVNNYPDYSVSYNALNLLKETYAENEITAKKDIYKSLFNKKGKKDLYALAGLLLSDIDKENKLKQIDEVITNYKGEKIVELALFDKLVYYNFEMNDKENSRAISKELDELFPLSQGAIEAHKILGDMEYYNIYPNPDQQLKKTTAQAPVEYALLGNYPNPFNPATTISYTLPQDGRVSIKVFDVLGREVAELINGFSSAGKHNVVWDGTNFASGIYFYSITFGNQTLNKKMLLMK